MTTPKLSVVVPTSGRPSLYETLVSVLRAGLALQDEVIVVGDGPQPEAREICDFLRKRFPKLTYMELQSRANNFGHEPSNHGYRAAVGTHILRMDDDDTYVPGALGAVRRAAAANPDRILIFQMRSAARRHLYDVLWKEQTIALGNVGTPMIVVPNLPGRIGSWGPVYCGDFDFLTATVAKHPDGESGVVWCKEIIADIY
jgi:glycosyltransferase involved in cell wall biosynthesis